MGDAADDAFDQAMFEMMDEDFGYMQGPTGHDPYDKDDENDIKKGEIIMEKGKGKTYTQAINIPRKVFAIDFDGILTDNNYADPQPVQRVCAKVQELYNNGHIIIIWTARPWSYAPQLVAWLTKFDIPFHGIQMFKGGADAYVDDKNMALRTMMGFE